MPLSSRVTLLRVRHRLLLGLAAWLICAVVADAQETVPLDVALELGWAEVSQVVGTGSGMLEPLKLTLTNRSGQKMQFEVPRGLILASTSPDYGDLIVAQSVSQSLGKDETRIVDLDVYSTDPDRSFSVRGQSYMVGDLVADERILAVLSSAATRGNAMAGQLALWLALTEDEPGDIIERVGYGISVEQVVEAKEILTEAEALAKSGQALGVTPPSPAPAATSPTQGEAGEEPAGSANGGAPRTGWALGVALLLAVVLAAAGIAWWFLQRRSPLSGVVTEADVERLAGRFGTGQVE